jgi:hypothetical protein
LFTLRPFPDYLSVITYFTTAFQTCLFNQRKLVEATSQSSPLFSSYKREQGVNLYLHPQDNPNTSKEPYLAPT